MNNNITEDYCSFEVSKLFYNKGARFACPHGRMFSWAGVDLLCAVESPRWKNVYAGSRTPDIVRPTHASAIKWIRENFGIHIHIDLVDNTREFYYQPEIINSKDREYHDEDMIDQAKRITFWKDMQFDSAEEATEAAILYTLKRLI